MGRSLLKPVFIRDGHDNFFTPIRLILALMVVIGHTYCVVLGHDRYEPQVFFDYTFSYIAVNLFFIASGFLVTKSILYRGDMPGYSSARILRIFPALAVHVLFVMFVVGPFVTNLPLGEFFTNPQFWSQPLQVLTFYQTDMVLPGAFATNSEQIGSAALWTLRYEIICYIATAAVFATGLMRKKWMLLAQFVFVACFWCFANIFGIFDQLPATVQSMLRFALPYTLGAAIFAYRERLSFHVLGIPLIGFVTILYHNQESFEVLTNIWLAYILFWAAYIKIPALDGLQRMNDISYGVYIYHWIVLQWLFYNFPLMGVVDLLLVGSIISVILAYLSWHIVEKPALELKGKFTKYLRFDRTKRVYEPRNMLLD